MWRSWLVLALLAPLLAGCLDLEQEIKLEADGTAKLSVRIAVDREMEDVYAALEALAKLSPDPQLALHAAGICSQASLDAVPPDLQVPMPMTARRYLRAERSVCEVTVALPELPLPPPDPSGLNIYTMRQSGERQWEMVLDLDKVPDLTPLVLLGLAADLQKRPDGMRAFSPLEMLDLIEKMKRGFRALTGIALRDRYFQMSVVAPRIVASAGATSNDDKSVQFRMSFAELVDLVLKPELRRGKRLAVTVAY